MVPLSFLIKYPIITLNLQISFHYYIHIHKHLNINIYSSCESASSTSRSKLSRDFFLVYLLGAILTKKWPSIIMVAADLKTRYFSVLA